MFKEAMSCLSSSHSVLVIHPSLTPKPDLLSLSSLLRCMRTILLSPGTKEYQILHTLWARVWPLPTLISKVPFIVQGNKYLLFGLFCISDLKDVYIQGKDSRLIVSSYPHCDSGPDGQTTPSHFSPGSLLAPIPSSLSFILNADVSLSSL